LEETVSVSRRYPVPAVGLLLCALVPGAVPRPAAAQITVPCQSVSPIDPSAGVLVGNARGGHFYASVPQSVSIDTETKVVVRMTGVGPLHISAIGPDQMTISPSFVDPHVYGSSYDNVLPGDEWGTGWKLPMPGCWDLHAERTGVSGDIYFNAVVPILKSFTLQLRSGRRIGNVFRSGTPITFAVHPQFDPSTDLVPSGTITIKDATKAGRTLYLRQAKRNLRLFRTWARFTVTAPTWFDGVVRLSFQGSTMTRDFRFEVVPAGR
jgi:hypothetical protein